jgi:methyltransferase
MQPLPHLGIALLAFVTLQRLAELVYARRNEKRLKAGGAREHAPEHYWLLVTLHGAWLTGLWLMAVQKSVSLPWLAAFVALQGLRLWVLLALRERWTTRIVVVPAAPLIKTGPYRFMAHPNYAIVAGEIFVLPMAFGLYAYAIVFSLLNAGILRVRIRAENRALGLASEQPR